MAVRHDVNMISEPSYENLIENSRNLGLNLRFMGRKNYLDFKWLRFHICPSRLLFQRTQLLSGKGVAHLRFIAVM